MNDRGITQENEGAENSAGVEGGSSVTPDAEPRLPNQPVVPDYELLRRIGGGAYGEVFLARSKATGILRAAKVVWRRSFDDDRPFQREFEGIQNFERISREHPSQLALFHIGRSVTEGYFYYVMELADDLHARQDIESYSPRTLRAEFAHGRIPAAQVLEIGLVLTEALGHLHRNGLVHRDIKPSNVIFVNGRPKLADIGLVTDTSDQCSIVGTEGYLPPEGPGTPQADIFALGKVLYEAVTGLDRRDLPKLPDDLRAWPDAAQVFELNEITLKACARDSGHRYQTCDEMRADLALLEQGKSVKQKRTRQQRTRIAWTIVRATAMIVAAAACGIFLWQTLIQRTGSAIVSNNEQSATAYRLGYAQLRLGTPEGFRNAAIAFTKAVQAEPKSVPPRTALFEAGLMDVEIGTSFNDEKLGRLNELAGDLAKIAPTSAETHAARAIMLWLNEGKLNGAESEFQQALDADPGSPMALTCYGYFLTRLGRSDTARTVLERALRLDPGSQLILKLLGNREPIKAAPLK